MTTPSRPEASVTADDVRLVSFSEVRRGGYDTHEVEAFLDRVAETLTALAAAPEPRPQVVDDTPRLHDPEGAAQRLLAAAQQTADTLTAEATSYAETTRSEADVYAEAVRREADSHATQVTTAAETQAETIRSVAADEARRMAEEARASLVEEIATLEQTRDALSSDCALLESHMETQRSRLLTAIDDLRASVQTLDLAVEAAPGLSTTAPADDTTAEEDPADEDPADEDLADEDLADEDEPTMAHDMAIEVEDTDDTHDDTEDLVVEEVAEPVVEDVEPVVDDATEDVDVEVEEEDEDEEDEAPVAVSVFDLLDDEDDDVSADWLDEPALANGARTNGAADSGADGLGLFDADEDLDVPAQAMPAIDDGHGVSGDRFFEELRQAERDDNLLGPLDDDTDAALAAFFEPDVDEAEERRSRFGRRR